MISDGIHINLSDADYHADPALGSTGIKKLLENPADYWWSSPLNPAQEPEKETPAKAFGRALHTCVLEGRDVFDGLYAPAEHPGNIKEGKAERKLIAEAGKLPLKRDDYNRIVASAAFIKTNPHLGNAFTNGLPEVSVFWTVKIGDVPIRLKARMDYLKPMAIADLKSIRNPYGKPFERACMDAIANYEYTLSAEHYMEGRRQLQRFVQQDDVWGANPDQSQFLEKVALIDAFAFVLVFYQAEGAPVSHGFKISPANPILKIQRVSINTALQKYAELIERFGEDSAWIDPKPLGELDETEMPNWWQIHKQTGE